MPPRKAAAARICCSTSKPLQIEHDGDAMLADTGGDPGQFGLCAGGVDHLMTEFVRQRDEIAFRIDDALLHPRRTLFKQAAQQMRLAGPRIALHQQAGRQQFLEIQICHGALGGAHVDIDLHPVPFLVPSVAPAARRREGPARNTHRRWRKRNGSRSRIRHRNGIKPRASQRVARNRDPHRGSRSRRSCYEGPFPDSFCRNR